MLTDLIDEQIWTWQESQVASKEYSNALATDLKEISVTQMPGKAWRKTSIGAVAGPTGSGGAQRWVWLGLTLKSLKVAGENKPLKFALCPPHVCHSMYALSLTQMNLNETSVRSYKVQADS